MAITLSPLPFKTSDLEPCISEETLKFHYEKHHKGYVDKTNAKIAGTSLDKASLKEIVMESDGGLYNLSAQAWNHEFYWNSLCAPSQKNAKDLIPKELLTALEKSFGSLEEFKKKFTQESLTHFGSGWCWLIKNSNDELQILSTHDADTPLKHGQKPLLTCDVWEHAYYIDYRNDRGKYLESFWKIVHWNFIAKNLNS